MRVNAMRVFVDDLAKARAFYEKKLGWPVAFSDEKAGVIGYDLGVTVIVENGDGHEPGLVGRFTGVSIWVDDIDAAHKSLTKGGVAFDGPPEAMSWGGRLAHFKDPAGNTLTLVSDVDVDDS